MPAPRAFQISPNKMAFTQSPHGSRNTFATQIQMAIALMNRVGYGKLWFNSSTGGIEAIGPLNNPAGSPTAIDPLFLNASMTWTWSGTANDGHSLAASITASCSWDAKYQDWTCAPDSNLPIIDANLTLKRAGLGSTFSVPGSYTSTVPPAPTAITYIYDTGDSAHLSSHSETNGSGSCSGYCIYSQWTDLSGNVHPALRVDWSLSSPIDYKTFVKYCDQLLQAITLLDAVAAPTKKYLTNSASGAYTYLRYPLEFQDFIPGITPELPDRYVANSVVALYDRSVAPNFDYYFAPNSGTNDGGIYDTFFNSATVPSQGDWIKILITSVPGGVGLDINWNDNPLFAHGCPCPAPWNFSSIDMSKLAGTPSAPADNVAGIFSLKSAFNTKKVGNTKAWVYSPGTNAWTLNTFSPTNSASQAGNFIYDPVANLAIGDVPAGYNLDPSGGLYAVDGTSPFTPASVDTTFGFVTGDI